MYKQKILKSKFALQNFFSVLKELGLVLMITRVYSCINYETPCRMLKNGSCDIMSDFEWLTMPEHKARLTAVCLHSILVAS